MITQKLPRFYAPFLALVVIALALPACRTNPSATPPAASPTYFPPKIFKLGDTIKTGAGVLLVLGWSEKDFPGYAQTSRMDRLDAGFQAVRPPHAAGLRPGSYITVDVLLVNTGQVAVPISSTLQMSLQDETVPQVPADAVDLMSALPGQKDTPDGRLLPGERIRGTVGFHLPPAPKALQFVFDASVFGGGKVLVALGAKPIAVQPPDQVEGETEPPASARLGQAVPVGAFSVTVNAARRIGGDPSNGPPDGYQFLVVDLTIENQGTGPAQISSLLQMWLKDTSGQRYRMDFPAMRAAKGNAPNGKLGAGEKLTGQVAFAVPKAATGLRFVFDDSLMSGYRISVALP